MCNKIREVISQLPMDDDQLLSHKNTIFKDSVRHFQGRSMIQTNEVSEIYIEKIADKLEEEYFTLLKENRLITKQVLNEYFNKNFKQMVNSNLKSEKYTCFEDYDKEVELFKEVFVKDMRGRASNIELLVDQIFLRYNSLIYKEISSSKHRKMELELAATRERLRIAEEDIQRGRRELSDMQCSFENKIKYLEDDRIQQVAQNQVLNEKLANKDRERETTIGIWQEKYNDAVSKLENSIQEYQSLYSKFENFKDSQLNKEAGFIKENSEIMNKKELLQNEIQFLKQQFESHKDLQEKYDLLKQEKTQLQSQLREILLLKEKQQSMKNDDEVSQCKLDLEHANAKKKEFEIHMKALQKENIEVINSNSSLLKQKQENKILTQKLLENLKHKLIEKHESN